MTTIDQKHDELNSYIEEQSCSWDKKLEELCENLFEKFRKQIEQQFTNELNKQSKRIEQLESDKIMLQHQILEIKKQNLQNQHEIGELEQYVEDCASGLKEFQQRRMKLVAKFQKRLWEFARIQGQRFLIQLQIGHTGMVYRMSTRQLKNHVNAPLCGFLLFATGQQSIERKRT